MKQQQITPSLIWTAAILLLGLVEWVPWTSEDSYLRHLLPLSTGFSYIVAIALLLWGLVRLSQTQFIRDLGEFVAYRWLATPQLLMMRESTANTMRLAAVGIATLLVIICVLMALPVLSQYHQSKPYFSLAYVFALSGILLLNVSVPKRMFWTYDTPMSTPGTGVFQSDGHIIYIEDRQNRSWVRTGPFAVLIDQRGFFLHLTKNLRRELRAPIQTPVFVGTIRAMFEPNASNFPAVLTNDQTARLEAFACADEKLAALLTLELNTYKHLLLGIVKDSFQIATRSISLQEDPVRSVYAGFAQMMDKLAAIDLAVFAKALSDSVVRNIFQAEDAPALFTVTVNLEDLTFTSDFQAIRNTLLLITQQAATTNQELQREIMTKVTDMLPILMTTTTEEPGKLMEQLKSVLAAITTQADQRPLIESGQATAVTLVETPPADPQPTTLPINRIRIMLETTRQLAPDADPQHLVEFIERQLRAEGILAHGEHIQTAVLDELLMN